MSDETFELERVGECKHPTFTDAAIEANDAAVTRSWGNVDPLKCPDCDEWLVLVGGETVIRASDQG